MRKRKCTVPFCKTIYSKKKRVTLFKVPENRKEQWEKALYSMKLTNEDRICAKHFSEEHIVRIVQTDKYAYELKIPRLTQDAVPTKLPKKFKEIFENGLIGLSVNGIEAANIFQTNDRVNYRRSYVKLNEKKEANVSRRNYRRQYIKRTKDKKENPESSNTINHPECIIIKTEEEDEPGNSDSYYIKPFLIGESINETNYSEDCTPNNSVVDNINKIFQRYSISNPLQHNTTESNWLYDISIGRVSLPDASWAIHSITNDDPLALSTMCLTKMIINNDTPITKFNIIVSDSTIKIYIFNKQIHAMNVEAINSLNEFEDLICRISTIECCYGVEEPLIPINFNNPSYRIDPLLNRWRHISCSYLIEDNRCHMCSNCKKIFKDGFESGQVNSTTFNNL